MICELRTVNRAGVTLAVAIFWVCASTIAAGQGKAFPARADSGDSASPEARLSLPAASLSLRDASLSLPEAWLPLPDAPDAQTTAASPPPKNEPCPRKVVNGVVSGTATDVSPGQTSPSSRPCKRTWASRYELFANGPQDKRLTPRDKAWLAVRNVADPFNNITILGEAAISVASDAHSPYGPGMPGYGRYVGVSYTQDMIGEFFGTFLIPSVVHQDPHYHRMPKEKIPRRIFHATYQVFWTQSDSGKGMLNYANVVGFAIDDGISNLYVPGRETSLDATGRRYAIGLATAPIGNYITEFVPDVARHIHVQIVILQRIINQVARSEGGQP